jgi:DNA adenine methylase
MFYDEVRDEFNYTHQPHHFLYLLARCVKAAVRYNGNGEFNQSPDNRRQGRHPDHMADHIERASLLLNGKVSMVSGDYWDAIADATDRDIVYMDPPYQGVSTNRDRRYYSVLEFDDFVATLETLNAKGISYIISYDGWTGAKQHGRRLPKSLLLGHFKIDAGRSAQATLLGHADRTIESLYLSPALLDKISGVPALSA